jgi:hypothetical protein
MTVENTGTDPVKPEETPAPEVTLKVDVYGEEIELPMSRAKAIIAKRDEKSKLFNEVSLKMKEYETKAQENARKAQALEAARSGDIQAAEAAFNQKLEEKVSKFRSKIVEGEIRSALSNHEDFLGGDVTADVIKLLKAEHNFDLGDDDVVKVGDKDVKTIVKEFLDSRPAFRKASKGDGKNRAVPTVKTPPKVANLGSAIKKLIK